MKICVVGAGAIGGLLAHKLSRTGADVSVVVRGPHLEAIRKNGLSLIENDLPIVVNIRAFGTLAEAGEPDLIILGLKANQITPIAHELAQMAVANTLILTAQNGIPWWYFSRHGGRFEGLHLESVDPGRVIADNLKIENVIASVVYPAARIEEPGVIRHIEGHRFSLSELDGEKSDRILQVSELFKRAGFRAPVVNDIRAEIWTKLWGNLCFNPISALSRATLKDICCFSSTRELASNMMREAQNVGEAIGIRFLVDIEKRIQGAESVGDHKTSMLQDVERGRPLEIEALLGAVIEIARILQIQTPYLDSVYALTGLLNTNLVSPGGLPVTGKG